MNEIQSESYYIKLNNTDTLHLRRFFCNPNGETVFALHGAVSCGRTFYSKSGKGLAPYLARNGFDVFVPDTRGKGESTPVVDSKSTYGLHEIITEDIPACLKKVREIKGTGKEHWVAHSWGGVLLLSYLAKNQDKSISTLTLLGCVKRVAVKNISKFYHVDFLWNFGGRILTNLIGYMPASFFYPKDCDESKPYFLQMLNWMNNSSWFDHRDGSDYKTKIRSRLMPPTLHLAAKNDPYLGNIEDIKLLMDDIHNSKSVLKILSAKINGTTEYDHTSMLVHSQAQLDVFPLVLQLIKSGTL